jgi:hypothetical protein
MDWVYPPSEAVNRIRAMAVLFMFNMLRNRSYPIIGIASSPEKVKNQKGAGHITN